jgi:hypothetical protein
MEFARVSDSLSGTAGFVNLAARCRFARSIRD